MKVNRSDIQQYFPGYYLDCKAEGNFIPGRVYIGNLVVGSGLNSCSVVMDYQDGEHFKEITFNHLVFTDESISLIKVNPSKPNKILCEYKFYKS